MQLSKSDYLLYLRHPAWLWLKKHDAKKLPVVDDATQAIFDTGYLFETYAEQLFPAGVRLGFEDYDGYLKLPEATREVLDGGAGTIFQGRFEFENFTFICDVIQVVEGNVVDLYEIKSSTRAKLEHEHDLAFQTVVLEDCGYVVRDISVIHVNNQMVRSGEVNPEDITKITDVTDKVKDRLSSTRENMQRALETALAKEMPDASPRHVNLGSMGNWLPIYKTLYPQEQGSIYDICSVNAKIIGELEDMNIKRLIDIPYDFKLTKKQRLQVDAYKKDAVGIETEKIRQFINGLEFPLYFLDYETMSSAIPYFDGLKPYQQLPFQYSLHVLESPDSELKHYEYLHRDKTNPGHPLSEALKSQIGTSGSVLTWNMGFEKGCNTQLGNLLPEFAEFFEQLNGRVADLKDPFSKDWYVHKDFNGSSSIKSVLPVLVPELSYKILGIQEGGAAQRLWMEAVLDGKRDEEKEKILSDLIEYCKLDTLAMVEIYKVLKKV